jgi:L-aspartate oxidase
MWSSAGLVRDGAGLSRAADTIAAWRADAPDPVSVAQHEDANLLLVAQAVVHAALARRTSVGAHWRSDSVPAEPVPAATATAELVARNPESLITAGAAC